MNGFLVPLGASLPVNVPRRVVSISVLTYIGMIRILLILLRQAMGTTECRYSGNVYIDREQSIGMATVSKNEKSYKLFTDAKRQGVWDPHDIDLEQDPADWETMSKAEAKYVQGIINDFWDGEENVARTLTPYPQAIDKIEDPPFDPLQEEMFLNSQIFEETKHTDFFERYFKEVLGETERKKDRQAYDDEGHHTTDLYEVQDRLMESIIAGNQEKLVSYAARSFMMYMGLMENQHARVGYVQMEQVLDQLNERYDRDRFLPGLYEGFTKVRTDEGRHIMNGQWMLANFADMDESVITKHYEPILIQYLKHRFPAEINSGPFDLDVSPLMRGAKQSMETTINIVGRDRFDEFSDVEAAILKYTSLTESDLPF